MKRTFALMAMLAGLTGSLALTHAQEPKKKDDKPAAKAPEKKAPEKKAAGSVVYYEGAKGWRFRIEGPDGKSISGCYKNYETKEEAIKAIEELKAILTGEKPVEGKAKD
jgi:hypothetical protein